MKARPTCVSISRLGERECGVKNPATFLELAGLALRLTVRRWPLFLIATLAAIAVQAAVALVWRVPHGAELGSAVALPLLVTLVYAFVSHDAGDDGAPASIAWERFLERAWAVIVIDFLLSDLLAIGLSAGMTQDALDIVLGVLAFGLSVLTVFADASATIDDDLSVWSVIPQGLLRSIAISWNARTFVRALAILSLQLLVLVAETALYGALGRLSPDARLFWAQIPILTLTAPPISALTAIVYREAKAVAAEQG